jgi:hypothetical protein
MYLAARILDESHTWNDPLMPDKLNPDEKANISTYLFDLLTRHSEKIASLEAGQAALKGDTEVIRSTLHGVNNNMQTFAIQEANCASNLKVVAENSVIQGATLVALTTAVNDLKSIRDQQKGIWWAIVRVCIVMTSVLGGVAAILSGLAWMLEHHMVINVH